MSVPSFGDFDTTETVVLPFNTFDSNDPSASVTATNLANTDVHIHKDGGLTQRSSAAGVAVDIDVDAIAGCHWVTIDLSDNTDAGFYADGSQYAVRIEGVTVDAGIINPWIGAFSIGRTLRPTVAGRTADLTAGGAIGIDWGNIENKTTANDLSATDIQLVDTATALTGKTGFSLSTAGVLAIWHQALSAVVTAGSVGKLIKDEITAVRMAVLTDWTDGGRLDLLLDAVKVVTDALTAAAAAKLALTTATVASGTVNDASATTTGFVSDLAEATDDHYNGLVLAFTDGALLHQKTDITDYDGGTKTLTFTALTEAPANGDAFVIL